MKTVPIGDGFLFAAGAAILTFLLPSHTEGRCFPPSEGNEGQRMGNPWFSSPSLKNIPPEYFLRYARKSRTAAHLECARLRRILRRTLVPLRPRFPFPSDMHFSRRQGGKVRTPHGGCAGRNQKTSRWDVFPYGCDRLARSSHKRRTEVWALSAAVRPAFAVLIYAPGEGHGDIA